MRKLKLSDRTVEINKLPLGKYGQLLEALEQLPKELGNLSGVSKDELVASLPKMIAKCLPEFLRVLNIATGLEEEYISALGLDEVVDIVLAVIDENNYKEIYDKIKKKTAATLVISDNGSGGR